MAKSKVKRRRAQLWEWWRKEHLKKAFGKCASIVDRHPRLTFLTVFLAFLLMALGMISLKSEHQVNVLWAPSDSRAVKDRQIREGLFDGDRPETQSIIIQAKDRGDVLRSTILREAQRLLNIITNNPRFQATCARRIFGTGAEIVLANESATDRCVCQSVFDAFDNNLTTLSRDHSPDATIARFFSNPVLSRRTPLHLVVAGGRQTSSCAAGVNRTSACQRRLTGAHALQLFFSVVEDTAERWDGEFVKIVQAFTEKSDLVEALPLPTIRFGFSEQISQSVTNEIPLLGAGGLLLFVFSASTMGRPRPLSERVVLSLVALICIGLAVFGSLGLMAMVGIPYTALQSVSERLSERLCRRSCNTHFENIHFENRKVKAQCQKK